MSSLTWRVCAVDAPRVRRSCPRCNTTRPFAHSGCFRVNGNGRKLDVWLIYRCTHCDRTWNREVFARVRPEDLGHDLVRYERNDPELAHAVACDVSGLDAERPDWVVRISGSEPPIRIEVEPGVRARLDAIIARALGLSRSAVVKLGLPKKRLKAIVRDGTTLEAGTWATEGQSDASGHRRPASTSAN